MQAVVKYAPGNGNVALMDVAEPECGDSQVKLEIAFCGVCGTDLHVLHDTFRNYPPVILGHELVGTVVERGRTVGDRVAIGARCAVLGATAVTCGQCQYCLSGHFIFCLKRRGMGHGVNGAFTRYVVVRPDQLFYLPDDISFEEAALTEPFAAAVQAVTGITDVRLGDTALISGPGPMGLLCLKLLVAEGIRTIVAGTPGDSLRLAAARRFGAASTVDIGTQSLADVIAAETEGRGVDVALECAGHPGSVKGCLESLRPMGRYTQVAICGREIPFPVDLIFYKQLTVRGSVCYTARTWDRVMDIYAQGRVRLGDLVSAKLPISDWQRAFELCEGKQGLKVLLHP